MRLRSLIEGGGPTGSAPPIDRPTPATLAIVATLRPEVPKIRPTVATVATVATLPVPESWPALLRTVTAPGVNWHQAADILDSLMAADVIERALILGWDVRELVGVWRFKPHDKPSRAGLLFSLRPGDSVTSIHDAGCAIAIAGSAVPHMWRRIPLPDDGSILPPWEVGSR